MPTTSTEINSLPPTSRPADATEKFLFSGHQTFALRIAWLTKAADAIGRGENPFSDIRHGVQILGIGKNMVEALKCWVDFFRVADFDPRTGKPSLTDFGARIFGPNGADRFLEDDQTLWLLHWNAVTNAGKRFFAWHWSFNIHNEREFTYDEALRAFKAESETYARGLSEVTLRQHLDVFLGTYVDSNSDDAGAVPEDTLDSPLAALRLIKEGEVRHGPNGNEQVYRIDSGPKHNVSDTLFRFCLHDWWQRFHLTEETMPFRLLCHGECSPGRTFRIPEREMEERIRRVASIWPNEFVVKESHNQRQVQRKTPSPKTNTMLREIYQRSQ